MNRHLLLVLWTLQRRIQFWVIVVKIENPALSSARFPSQVLRPTSPGDIRWAGIPGRFLNHAAGPRLVLRRVEGPESRIDLVGHAGERKSAKIRLLVFEL